MEDGTSVDDRNPALPVHDKEDTVIPIILGSLRQCRIYIIVNSRCRFEALGCRV